MKLKLYAIVVRKGIHGKPEILKDRDMKPMVFTTKKDATAARVEEACGADDLLKAWKIVPFTEDPSS